MPAKKENSKDLASLLRAAGFVQKDLLLRMVDFRPSKSMTFARDALKAGFSLTAGWNLCRLAAWALYDQQDSKKSSKDAGEAKAIRRISTSRAHNSGQLHLLHSLKPIFVDSQNETSPSDRDVFEAFAAFFLILYTDVKRKNFGLGGSWSSTLHNKTKGRNELATVYLIMDCLVRIETSNQHELLAVWRARAFVKKYPGFSKYCSRSQLEKIWDHYRDSAPYIYALFPIIYGPELVLGKDFVKPKISDETWNQRINSCLRNEILEEIFGNAAFAADMLRRTGTRRVRLDDFKDIPRKRPAARAFSSKEIDDLAKFELPSSKPGKSKRHKATES